jgi:hypothetical protein|tara:strand:+ start:2001 stop:2123 length:123 start_codon:yes stop_codon:yes gene_type:complete
LVIIIQLVVKDFTKMEKLKNTTQVEGGRREGGSAGAGRDE